MATEIQASTNGRPLTRESTRLATHEPTIVVEEFETTIWAGLRVPWFDGTVDIEGEEWSFDVTCGAGVGSSWMVCSIEKANGERVELAVTAEQLLNTFLATQGVDE